MGEINSDELGPLDTILLCIPSPLPSSHLDFQLLLKKPEVLTKAGPAFPRF